MKKWKVSLLAGMMAIVMMLTACAGKPAGNDSSETSTASETSSETSTETSSETSSEASSEASGESSEVSLVSDEGQELSLEGMLHSRRFGDIPEDYEAPEPNEMDEEGIAALDRARAGYSSYVSAEVRNNGTHFYYYDKLNAEQQMVYDALYLLAQDPTTTDNIIKVDLSKPINTEGYRDEVYWTAYLAFNYDHPEFWWLYYWNGTYDVSRSYSSTPDENGKYALYLQMSEPYTNYEQDVKDFNAAVDAFMSGIDLSKSQTEIARQIHDKLINLVAYDYPVLDRGCDFGHTVFGALVRDSVGVANTCVCDGYAQTYAYLLNQAGIEATTILGWTGGADKSTSSYGKHAWSIINIDGKWYEVDACWDDNTDLMSEITYAAGTDEYNFYAEMTSNTAFMDKINHAYFMVTTDRINNFVAGEDYYFKASNNWYINYYGNTKRYRCVDYPSTWQPENYLTGMLPIA